MAWTAAPRNTTTISKVQAAASTITATLTVTAVVAGDLTVVGLHLNGSAISSITPPAGQGWVQVVGSASGGLGMAIYATTGVPAGTTSLAFSAAGTSLIQLGLIYGAWAGGRAYAPPVEGTEVPQAGLGTSLTTVTSSGHTILGDLAIWLGASYTNTAVPSNPTGTGTWTSVNTLNSSGNFGLRMSAQVDASAANQVASGSTVPAGGTGTNATIAAFPPSLGRFFALMGR